MEKRPFVRIRIRIDRFLLGRVRRRGAEPLGLSPAGASSRCGDASGGERERVAGEEERGRLRLRLPLVAAPVQGNRRDAGNQRQAHLPHLVEAGTSLINIFVVE